MLKGRQLIPKAATAPLSTYEPLLMQRQGPRRMSRDLKCLSHLRVTVSPAALSASVASRGSVSHLHCGSHAAVPFSRGHGQLRTEPAGVTSESRKLFGYSWEEPQEKPALKLGGGEDSACTCVRTSKTRFYYIYYTCDCVRVCMPERTSYPEVRSMDR